MSLPEAPTYLEVLPPRARKIIYAAYVVLGALGTAALAFYGSVPGMAVPGWLTGGMAALGSLSTAGFVVAITKVNAPTATLTGYAPGDVVTEVDAEPDELPDYDDGLDQPLGDPDKPITD